MQKDFLNTIFLSQNGNGQTNHLPNQKKITMAKVEIASWSELSLMESLLDEFLTKNGKKHSKYYTAKELYQRVRNGSC